MLTAQDVKNAYREVFYLEDDSVLDLLMATVIATYMKSNSIWLLIVGPPSGGKSELINSFFKVPFVHEVSDMTENTFLSGMNSIKEASLLKKIGNLGCLAMKDFTSLISMRSEKREVIMAQMRHIFDGHFEKKTGNGQNPSWIGKMNFIGGVTEAIYNVEDESSSMGRRNIHYILPLQDRLITTRMSRKNRADGTLREKISKIQIITKEYVSEIIASLPATPPEIDTDLSEEILNLSDFCTIVRTPTTRDYKNNLTLIPSIEMPMRISDQLHSLAEVLHIMYNGIPEQQKKAIFKIAMDSMPKQRRMTLQTLCKYERITTRGLAVHLKYPTAIVRAWLEDLNVLNVAKRETTQKMGMGGIDFWRIGDEFRTIMEKYDNIKNTGGELLGDSDEINYRTEEIDPGVIFEQNKNFDEQFGEVQDGLF